jgi:hypothetical protein
MENSNLEKLRYPIEKFTAPQSYSKTYLSEKVSEIAAFPEILKKEVAHLTAEQLDTCYREGGWTIRQVIHHCAESHMNCYIRIKWTLTDRLAYIMNNLSETDLEKTFIHPENGNEFPLNEIIGTYAWHGNHHLAHITELKKRSNW